MNIDLLFARATKLPSIPAVVAKVIASLNDDDVLTSEIAEALAADQALSASVLRLANSAYYNVPRTVSTIDDALRLLGFLSVRSLVLGASMSASFAGLRGVDLVAHWRHAIYTAVAARYLAKSNNLPGEMAFTVGLLHGIGRLVMQAAIADELAALDPGLDSLPTPERLAAERAALSIGFADVGAELAARWNFPDAFPAAIRGAADTPLAVAVSRPVEPLHALLYIASIHALAALGARPTDNDELQAIAVGAGIPKLASDVIGMPPLSELAAGLDAMISA
jgi:HD-like signal output (HDOD) protein